MAGIAALWVQLWPNLLADILAASAAWGAHHRWTRQHTAAVHARLDAIHARLETLHADKASPAATAGAEIQDQREGP